jgi:hypothetical protein
MCQRSRILTKYTATRLLWHPSERDQNNVRMEISIIRWRRNSGLLDKTPAAPIRQSNGTAIGIALSL